MSNVERVVEPIINLFQRIATEYEDDNSAVTIALVLDTTDRMYYIQCWNGDDDAADRRIAAPLEDIRYLQEEIVLATKKFAILCPSVSIAIFRSDQEEPIFSTFGKTLQEKVAEFHDISLRDMFVVTADHEGCDIEVCFFVGKSEKSEDKTQMIFTTNYFNPVATEMLVIKLLTAEADHESVEHVGFIGKLSDDHYTRVERAVEIVFAIFLKRVKEMERNLKHLEDIEDFISTPVEPLRRKAGPIPITKPSSERWSSRLRSKPAVVDLTEEKEENAAYILSDEVSSSFLHEYACSDIFELPEKDDYYDKDLECLTVGWDDQVHAKPFTKPPYDFELFDDWLLALKDNKHKEYFEDGFVDTTSQEEEPLPVKPRLNLDDDGLNESENTTNFDYYQQKATGSSSGSRRLIPVTKPQLGRGLRIDEDVEFGEKPRKVKSNLFTDDEIEKHEEKKRNAMSQKSFIAESLFEKTTSNSKTLPSDYKIPKKQGSTSSQGDWAPKKSVLSTPKSPYSRNPIHSNTQSTHMNNPNTIFAPSRSQKALQCLKLPFASPTLPSLSGVPKFRSKRASDDDNDVILVDDDAENEPKSNDSNNNQKPKRRALYTEPSPGESTNYKFFKSKQKPDFKRYDGANQ